MKKGSPQKARILTLVILALGAVIAFIGTALEFTALIFIGIAVMCFSMMFHIIFHRCPHCASYLGRSTGDYCPHCGKFLY